MLCEYVCGNGDPALLCGGGCGVPFRVLAVFFDQNTKVGVRVGLACGEVVSLLFVMEAKVDDVTDPEFEVELWDGWI